jgi:non-heme chloroperoxidase
VCVGEEHPCLAGSTIAAQPRTVGAQRYKKQSKNSGVTEYAEVPGRGHSLIIDHGWPDVADLSLKFVEQFVSWPS